MASEVFGIEEFRRLAPALIGRLRDDPDAPEVPVGRHRRREAVLVSAAEYDRLLAARNALEEAERLGALALVDARRHDAVVEGTVGDLFAAVDDLLA